MFYYKRLIGPFYISVIITLLIWFCFNFLMNYTRTGRHIYAIGSNVDAARLSGVDVFRTTTIAYMISAFCSFVAGLITMAAAGMGSMQAGLSYEMYGVAAAVIGGISTLGGSGYLVGTIAGAAVWAILQNGLTMASVPVALRNIIIGVIVVACVLMDIARRSGLSLGKAFKKSK
jgi:ribose transport system permease protein